MKAWEKVVSADIRGSVLELRKRGEKDFMLTIDSRVLMTSMLHRTEDSLAKFGVEHVQNRDNPRVLTAGFGLGFTLRALLDVLPARSTVDVCDLYAPVLEWARGPLAALTKDPLGDRRVSAHVADVMDLAAQAASGRRKPYDLVALDLMEGPNPGRMPALAGLYGQRALAMIAASLAPNGVYAVWGEESDPSFLGRLGKAGLDARAVRVGGDGGPRHVIYLAKKGTLAPPPGREIERTEAGANRPKPKRR